MAFISATADLSALLQAVVSLLTGWTALTGARGISALAGLCGKKHIARINRSLSQAPVYFYAFGE